MANNLNGSKTFKPSHVDLDILETLLEPEDNTYPWNPADEQSDDYFLQLEQQFHLEDVLNEEITARSQAFYNQLDNLWSGLFNTTHYKCSAKPTVVSNLQKTLQTSFANRVPQDWLKSIAQKAAEIFDSQLSMGEQLVQCVQSVLPTWESDDLSVMARPFAYAMRSGEPQGVQSAIDSTNNRDWAVLSEIEKAKVSLTIAYYALNELNKFQEDA